MERTCVSDVPVPERTETGVGSPLTLYSSDLPVAVDCRVRVFPPLL